MRTDIPAPGENVLATLKMGVHLMRQGGYISDHEQKLGTKIAEVTVRRKRHSRHSDQRTICPRPGTRSLQIAVRREKDAGKNSVHAENRQDAA